MEITIRTVTEHDVTIVEIIGRVDSITAEQLVDELAAQLEQNRVRLVADLGGVDYTSSAGLRALLATVKNARRRGGDFRLARVQPPVMRVLTLSGFTSILNMFPDAQTAIDSFATSSA